MTYFEKININVDKKRLVKYIDQLKTLHPNPHFPYRPGYGGWSLQSTEINGSYADCWKVSRYFNTPTENTSPSIEREDILNQKYSTDCRFGYISEIMDQLESLGFLLRRSRIAMMPGRDGTKIHRDCDDDIYRVRIHVPIITNNHCYHIWYNNEGDQELHREHLSPGNVYAIKVNNVHQAINDGLTTRYHLVMTAWDINGYTETMKFKSDVATLYAGGAGQKQLGL